MNSASPRSFLLVVGLAVCILPMQLACQSDEEKMVTFLENGEAYVEEGSLNEAVIEFRNVLQLDPNHAGARGYLPAGGGTRAGPQGTRTGRLRPEGSGAPAADLAAQAQLHDSADGSDAFLLAKKPGARCRRASGRPRRLIRLRNALTQGLD